MENPQKVKEIGTSLCLEGVLRECKMAWGKYGEGQSGMEWKESCLELNECEGGEVSRWSKEFNWVWLNVRVERV